MKLQNKVLEQMASPLCFLKIFSPVLPLMFALAPVLILAGFLGYGLILSIFLTSTALILSSLILTFSKQKQTQVQKSVTDEIVMPDQASTSPYIKDVISKPLVLEKEFITEEEEEEEGGRGQVDEYLVRSSQVITSESDCLGRSSTSEDSEVEWLFQDKMFQSRDCSDGSISDEDSLIEISLPGGHYICDHEEDEVHYNLQNKLPDFAPGSFFKQHGLMELLAELNEMNEEENLIEIDISMGSIKCPRFEIEA